MQPRYHDRCTVSCSIHTQATCTFCTVTLRQLGPVRQPTAYNTSEFKAAPTFALNFAGPPGHSRNAFASVQSLVELLPPHDSDAELSA